MRLEYTHGVRIVRLPCTGKTDVRTLLETFLAGADGVMVIGCLEGECHYIRGNIKARARVARTRKILDETRIGGERLRMYNLSASQAQRFAEAVNEMTDTVRAMGPSPLARHRALGAATPSAPPGDEG
jgi:coenzyme F420-reducing hydrogenase delta subunit